MAPPLDDEKLRRVLRAWTVPNAPVRLESRVFGQRRRRYWIARLSPAKRALALVAALILVTLAIFVRPVRLSHFQPVDEVRLTIIRSDHADH